MHAYDPLACASVEIDSKDATQPFQTGGTLK
jgi:hypothetical protein